MNEKSQGYWTGILLATTVLIVVQSSLGPWSNPFAAMGFYLGAAITFGRNDYPFPVAEAGDDDEW